MNSIQKDVDNTDLVIRNYVIKNCDKVYYASNEDLSSIFSYFDFKDENVLTVLGSGDQAFHFYDNNVSKLDFFDINKFTIYYFYLRIWNIENNNEFYLPPYFDYEDINNIVNGVKPKSDEEEKAYLYWTLILEKYKDNMQKLYGFFREGFSPLKNKIKDLDKIKAAIEKRNFNFNIFDISQEVNLRKKYDVIYASNIGDWVDEGDFERYLQNLEYLLSDDGMVIFPDLSKRYGASIPEKEYFEKDFEYHEIPMYNGGLRKVISGYYFTKKRLG